MSAGDTIELRGLRLTGVVGVLPHERAQPQPLELDLDIRLDLGAAAASDSLDDTADYGALCTVAERTVSSTSHALLETLADRVAGDLLLADPRIESVTVVVRKLRPPVAQQLGTAGVRVTRARA